MIRSLRSLTHKSVKEINNDFRQSYVPYKEFEKYRQDLDTEITVVWYTYFDPVKMSYDKADSDKHDYISLTKRDGSVYYTLLKQLHEEKQLRYKKVFGYALMEDGQWVALCRHRLLPLIFLLAITIACCLGVWADKTPTSPGLDFEGTEITEESDIPAITEYTAVPGFYDVTLTKDTPSIRLVNPVDNTVYFKYTLTCDGAVIWETKAIPPDKMVEANLYDKLERGDHKVTISISTFDQESEAPCNGSSQTITVTVKK